MNKAIKACLFIMAILHIISGCVITFAEDAYINPGDYNEDVIALHTKMAEFGYFHLRPESPWGPDSSAALKILQENIGIEIDGIVKSREQLEEYLHLENVIGRNLAIDTSSDWSEWFTPATDQNNRTFYPFIAILNDKVSGDFYTCSVEIQFRNVRASTVEGAIFSFYSQGTVDGEWNISNIWNSGLVRLNSAPEDGIYQYSFTSRIDEVNKESRQFVLGYRCDYWGNGSFRVRNVKVEKGSKSTEWCE